MDRTRIATVLVAAALLLGCQSTPPASPPPTPVPAVSPTGVTPALQVTSPAPPAPAAAAPSPSPAVSPALPPTGPRTLVRYYKTFSGGHFQRGFIASDGSQGYEELAGRLQLPPNPDLGKQLDELAQRFAAFRLGSPGLGDCTELEFLGAGPATATAQDQQAIGKLAGC